LVTIAAEGQPRIADAVSFPEDDARWTAFVRWIDLPAIYRLLRQSGGSMRITGERLTNLACFRTAGERSPPAWLAAALTTLDGRELGAIQAFDTNRAEFTPEDEAALVHLSQMASATIERTQLYHRRH
jgi:hypothetical protein